jgi:hypothetical protein
MLTPRPLAGPTTTSPALSTTTPTTATQVRRSPSQSLLISPHDLPVSPVLAQDSGPSSRLQHPYPSSAMANRTCHLCHVCHHAALFLTYPVHGVLVCPSRPITPCHILSHPVTSCHASHAVQALATFDPQTALSALGTVRHDGCWAPSHLLAGMQLAACVTH